MVNNFGKFCRKLRIDRSELLYDMAKKLGVSSAFLSKVENGKKKPPKEWRELIIDLYDLNAKQIQQLDQYLYEAQNYDSIDISYMEDEDRMMMLSFARKFKDFDKNKLKKILESESDNECILLQNLDQESALER